MTKEEEQRIAELIDELAMKFGKLADEFEDLQEIVFHKDHLMEQDKKTKKDYLM